METLFVSASFGEEALREFDPLWPTGSKFRKGLYTALTVKNGVASISAIVRENVLTNAEIAQLRDIGLTVEQDISGYYFIKGTIPLTEIDKIEEARKLLLLR